jgi:glyoxylase-like metal-dependent hydrolase (beta-lactamase superfamily II)
MMNAYLVISEKFRVLIDTGSGFGVSNQDLEKGLTEVSKIRDEDCGLDSLTHIFITHGHIDHYGGLNFIREHTPAKICIDELDQKIVSNHRERLCVASYRLEEFLLEAGVPAESILNILYMYKVTKSLFQSVNVDITYESMGMEMGPFKFFHVPGHCAGHVIIQLDDVLFSGDHILKETSPHQVPQQITQFTGVRTYLNSLEIAQSLADKINITLGGHEDPIVNLSERIDEIRFHHLERLKLILKILDEPHTINEVSKILFGKVSGYTILLALEETGAHVEYLYQRGFLEITNLIDLEDNSKLGAILYRTTNHQAIKI